MKVFYCRNCGFFHAWEKETKKGIRGKEYEGFRPEKSLDTPWADPASIQEERKCPVCSGKGFLSGNGPTVLYELTQRKRQFLTVRKFFYMEIKRKNF